MKKIAWVLLLVGGVNWGLVGVGMLMGGQNLNIVNLLLGGSAMLEGIVYLLVGVSAVLVIFGKCGCNCGCKSCETTS